MLSRKQRTNNSYSTWFDILFALPQGSILGPLLFNIFLADLFFILNEVNVANDNTLYTSSNDIKGLINSLEEASKALFKWFYDNLVKSNLDKCHLFVRIKNFQIKNTKKGMKSHRYAV